MERIVDKGCVACISCVALLCFGRLDAWGIVSMLVAIIISAAFELAEERVAWRRALPMLEGLLGVCSASGLWVMPLVAYDLARLGSRWLCILPVPFLVAYARGGAFAELLLCTALCLFSWLLSYRTSIVHRYEGELHSLRDDLQERLLDLKASRRDLENARSKEILAATLAERARISRDIHDNVGHLLTRAIYQVEALEVVHAGEPVIQEELGEVGTTVRQALDVTRASVHAMADEAQDLSLELERLANDSGIDTVTLSIEIDEEPPASITRCMISICREALTNAVRHAHARSAQVRIVEYPGLWQIIVKNDGELPKPGDEIGGSPSAGEAEGMGIRTMRERVEALGGTLRVSYRDEFTVFASIPRR